MSVCLVNIHLFTVYSDIFQNYERILFEQTSGNNLLISVTQADIVLI